MSSTLVAASNKHGMLADRKDGGDFSGKVEQQGAWDHYKSLSEEELCPKPRLPGQKPKKVIVKSCKFHCCPNDGHTTHCFMYNDYDGIASGVVTCMFSMDRLPAGFKMPAESDSDNEDPTSPRATPSKRDSHSNMTGTPDIENLSVVEGEGDPTDGQQATAQLKAAKRRLAAMQLELAQARDELGTQKALKTIAKGSPPAQNTMTLVERQFDAQRKRILDQRGDRDSAENANMDRTTSFADRRTSAMHGRSFARDRPGGLSHMMPGTKLGLRDNAGGTNMGISALPRFNRYPKI